MVWLAGELGRARDLDVFISEGLASVQDKLPLPGDEKLLALAERHRACAYEAVRSTLDTERYGQFKRDSPVWLTAPGWEQAALAQKQRERLDMDIVKFALKRLDRLERGVIETGADLDRQDALQMHRLRITCKKLRYATEFFSPIIPGLDDFIGHLKELQDVLGVLNDVSVMSDLLANLLAGEHDPDVIRYASGLVDWRARQCDELLNRFEDRWQAFVHARHPRWHHRRHGEHRT